MWQENVIETYDFPSNCSGFMSAIDLLANRPHLVDKRLSGAVCLERTFSKKGDKEQEEIKMLPVSHFEGCLTLKRKLIRKKNPNDTLTDSVIISWPTERSVFVQFMIDENENESYAFKVDEVEKKLQLFSATNAPKSWLNKCLSKKLIQWSLEPLGDQALTGSLKLILIEEYTTLYQKLKDKYFDEILSLWDTESTNGEKFIHEDLGIATYLLLIWKSKPPKSFVDLGCGNGLLVYLLTKEGIEGGVGLDLRKRKIWNYFREKGADLRVETIEAKADDKFKNYDWLIGNHSDELTPWLPVMAKLSNSNFFLLPCCAFDFFAKYQTTT